MGHVPAPLSKSVHQRYRVIAFDLGGVLFTNGATRFIVDISRKHGLSVRNVEDVIKGHIGSLYREAKITREEFWNTFVSLLKINRSPGALERQWFASYELVEEVRDIVISLSTNYTVVYLSSNFPERVKFLQDKYGFLDWFDDGVFSYEVAGTKREQRIFSAILERTGFLAHETILIDDNPNALEIAAGLGFTTVLFTSAKDLRFRLEQLGVLDAARLVGRGEPHRSRLGC
jgi:HAD superfamily hydrolase (TIGR01509 family)